MEAVWSKYGLAASRLFRAPAVLDPQFSSLTRASRFRLALEELGGIFPVFGRFLAGRVDILPATHAAELTKIRLPQGDFLTRADLEAQLGHRLNAVVPVRSSSFSEVFKATYHDQSVVVEVFKDVSARLEGKAWQAFLTGIKLIEDSGEHKITESRTLEEFRQWLQLQSDPSRKRNILCNLQDLPSGLVSRFPPLVPELQSESILAYQQLGGETLKSAALLTEAFLEESLFLSVIPIDLDLDDLVVTQDGGVGFDAYPALATVPAEWNFELLQYMAASVAKDTPRAIHMLARIAARQASITAERQLWQEFSAVQPDLTTQNITPETVSTLQHHWQALGATSLTPPLFLQLFHRQLSIIGYRNAASASDVDLVSETIWSVMGRIFSFRSSQLLSSEKGREWAWGTGLLFFQVARQLEINLERFRDNDLAMVVDTPQDVQGKSKRRATVSLSLFIVLVVFLVALQFSIQTADSMLRNVATVAMAIAGVFLFFLIARIE